MAVTRRLREYFISLDVLDTEAERLEHATGVKWDERVGGVVTKEPSDGSASVVFQVRAHDPEAAYAAAVEAYEALRSDAGLDPTPPLAASVTVLRDLDETATASAPSAPKPAAAPRRVRPKPSGTPSTPAPPKAPTAPRTVAPAALRPHERWLEKARDLLTASDPDYATVAAQTACEVAIAETLRQLIAKRAPRLQVALEKLIGGRFTLANGQVLALWAELTGDTTINKASFWEPYTRHRVRRNAIVHEGQSVTAPQAAESVAIAEELCSHVIGFAP